MKKYNPQPFLFKLFIDKEILSEFEESLAALFEMCADADEAALIEHIAAELVVLSQKQLVFALKSMGASIVQRSEGKNTAVVATCMDGTPDSSHMIVQMLKPII